MLKKYILQGLCFFFKTTLKVMDIFSYFDVLVTVTFKYVPQ